MSPPTGLGQEIEGRRGSRIDSEEGAAISVFPKRGGFHVSRVSTEPGAVHFRHSALPFRV